MSKFDGIKIGDRVTLVAENSDIATFKVVNIFNFDGFGSALHSEFNVFYEDNWEVEVVIHEEPPRDPNLDLPAGTIVKCVPYPYISAIKNADGKWLATYKGVPRTTIFNENMASYLDTPLSAGGAYYEVIFTPEYTTEEED